MITRRGFLGAGAGLAAGLLVGVEDLKAIEPIPRKGAPSIKVGCAAYSYRAYLAGKDPTMTLETFMDTAAEIGCDGVELTSYYFPPDFGIGYINGLKRRAFLLGLDISATSVGNRFTFPPGPERNAQLESVNEWIDHAAEMGAPCIRIFAGGAPEGASTEEAAKWVVECIEQCAGLAEERGVVLALENHGGVTSTAEQILAIAKAVHSDWVGINLDTGNFQTAHPYSDVAKVAPYAVTTHYKTEMRPAGAVKEAADPRRIVKILADVGYRGYFTLEYEGAEDAKTAVPKKISAMRKAANS